MSELLGLARKRILSKDKRFEILERDSSGPFNDRNQETSMNGAHHKLTENFAWFLKRVNPSPTYQRIAASEHSQIAALIENKEGPAGDLRIRCFLQGSYKRDTAIHTINDVDVVALCSLSYAPQANRNTRDQVFERIGDAIAVNKTYANKVRHGKESVCVKVMLEGIKIEVLPALRTQDAKYEYEPFYMFSPSNDPDGNGHWTTAFARYHQRFCTDKNALTQGLFIPMIKILKHLRAVDSGLAVEDAKSFHIECVLHALKDSIYSGSMAECIEAVLTAIAGFTPEKAEESAVTSPCKDKRIFGPNEWSLSAYGRFHTSATRWRGVAARANQEKNRDKAIDAWKELLGDTYFPRTVQ
jgi:Second Messenger Oligonucleotide or Dinucleotide Synthetase domain